MKHILKLIIFDNDPIHFIGMIDQEIVLSSKVYDTLEACTADASLIISDKALWEHRLNGTDETLSDVQDGADDSHLPRHKPFESLHVKAKPGETPATHLKNTFKPQTLKNSGGALANDLMEIAAETEQNFKVTVFYGTDRKRTGNADFNSYYGKDRGALELGTCTVNIPANKKFGDVPRPKWWKLRFKENPDKDVMILKLEPQSEAAFYGQLSQKIAASKEKDAFVFIHGYNVEFAEAAWRAGQMAYDLGFDGAPIMYSWPSHGTVKGYTGDEDNVRWTVPNFTNFIKGIIASGVQRLHIISHSMGNRALADMLKELKTLHPENPHLFNQIILAAPDIDSEIFIRDVAPVLSKTCKRATLYASSKDKALKASRALHNNILRAGQSGEAMVIVEGIDTVDASGVDTDLLGHGYFAATAPLINDIFQLIKSGASPEDRNLKKNTLNNKTFWKFPKGV